MKISYGPVEKGFFAGTYAIHIKLQKTPKNLEKVIEKLINKDLKFKNILIYEPFLDSNDMLFMVKAFQKYGYRVSLKISGETLYQWIDNDTWVIVENNDHKKLFVHGNELWFEIKDKKTKEPEQLPKTPNFHYFVYGADSKIVDNFIKTSKYFWRLLPICHGKKENL